MKKTALTLGLLVGVISFSTAQTSGSKEVPARPIKAGKAVILTEKKPTKQVKSIKVENIGTLSGKKEEAIIEEKETNQK